MRLFDQHVHSNHSFDSQTDPADNVRCAIARGLAGLTFTEHLDTHPDEWGTCVYDDAAYSATIERLRVEFGRAIFIGKGVEVCYQPERMDFILDFLAGHRFDVVVLSVHYFGDRPVHVRESWEGIDPVEGTRRYFETVLDAVRSCERLNGPRGRVFDVLGHMDLVKRYTRRFFDTNEVSRFGALQDEILRACLAADVMPELNTSTWRQNLEEPMPGCDTVARYARLGGTAMSIGSDAHLSASVGADFDRAVAVLREAGLGHSIVFKGRDKILLPLE